MHKHIVSTIKLIITPLDNLMQARKEVVN